ncbi:MAG TPA: ABC transporter ATP-binding protein [Gemmatimonadales bacterium]|nr:ABC transporter ATP-binding protein [Gemmatimonadales bacterium]
MIRFESVSKTYRSLLGRRQVHAVSEFSLEIGTGEVFGIAGPNGAGKSTLINVLLGFLQPTSGRVTIDGLKPRDFVETRGVSYLSELVAIPPGWRVERALARYAVLADVPSHQRPERIESAIATLGLAEHRRKKVKQLSKGNLQRLGLAQALVSDSDLVILDEPTHGFDPIWTQRFRDIARELRRPGRTVVIASHNLDELERVADRVGIIDHGQLQQIAEIGARATGSLAIYRVVVATPTALVAEVFPGAEKVRDVKGEEYRTAPLDLTALNEGLQRLIQSGVQVVAVVPERSQLEAVFRKAVGAEE